MADAPYIAPLEDLRFALECSAGLHAILAGGEYSAEVMDAVLNEAARFAENELSPLNFSGDREGCRMENGCVKLPAGFVNAYTRFIEQGWNAAPFPIAYGGQGLPHCVGAALQEIWHSANLSFALIPLLTQSAIHLLMHYGSDWQKEMILSRLVSGQWCGTMCMTEPQAGSDVGANRAQALPQPDGSYRLKGNKIFISAGDHDAAENIIHMVLARLPDAPAGTKGLSLFMVPKFLINEDGSLGAANDLHPLSLEHKMGMHASPTAVMAFGDNNGAHATLIGEPHQGMKAMFIMMNAARIAVGMEGLGIAEAATQKAVRYAAERVQGRATASTSKEAVSINQHRDVQRMLMWMESHTHALRALSLYTNSQIDNAATSEQAKARVDMLTPVVKAHTTSLAFAIASEAVQVHGGLGYVEETGVAQHLRDVRVTMIYEGTNGIQALDLALRKLPTENGAVMHSLINDMRHTTDTLSVATDTRLKAIGHGLADAITYLEKASHSMLEQLAVTTGNQEGKAPVTASAVPFLTLFGLVLEGWLLAQQAQHAATAPAGYSPAFLVRKIALAQFFAQDVLLDTHALHQRVLLGERLFVE
jgi:alkylation response protein AidB-like acyl-CoA dehydrogenase